MAAAVELPSYALKVPNISACPVWTCTQSNIKKYRDFIFHRRIFSLVRALVFLNNNFNKKMPSIVLNDEDKKLIALVNRELKQYNQLMDLIK